MSDPPRSEREQDLMREIVELVGGSRLRRRDTDRPVPPPVEPAPETGTKRAPEDDEQAP